METVTFEVLSFKCAICLFHLQTACKIYFFFSLARLVIRGKDKCSDPFRVCS